MPKVNAMANRFGGTTTTYKNENVQLCQGVYTADYDCRTTGLPEAVMELALVGNVRILHWIVWVLVRLGSR